MALPKTRQIGKKRYGLQQTTVHKRVGKKAVTHLHKKGTPARLVKSVDTRYGVYAGAPKPAPKVKPKRAAKRPVKRGKTAGRSGEFMPDDLLQGW